MMLGLQLKLHEYTMQLLRNMGHCMTRLNKVQSVTYVIALGHFNLMLNSVKKASSCK